LISSWYLWEIRVTLIASAKLNIFYFTKLWLFKGLGKELTNSKEEIVLSFDDSIEEKYYSDQSELICWHFDHVFKRSVKGVNFLTALVNIAGVRLPCAVEFVKKDKWVTDEKQESRSVKALKQRMNYIVKCYGCKTKFQ